MTINIQKFNEVAEAAKARTSDKRWQNAIDKAVAGVTSGWWVITELHDGVYAQAFARLKATGFELRWQSRADDRERQKKAASKTKYTSRVRIPGRSREVNRRRRTQAANDRRHF
jgi:hypothetical protein